MKQRRGILAAIGLTAAMLYPTAGPTAGFGLEVTPGKLEISVPGGATYNVPITVRNSGFEPVHVQASMVDFGVGSDGGYQFQRVGTRPYSLLKWASIRPREFDIPAGQVVQVQLTIAMPQASLSGEYGGIVFFQTRPARRRGEEVSFSVRVASKIYETIPGTVQLNGAITKMSAANGSRGESYRVTFKNTGNTHVYVRGQLVVQQGGNTVEQLELANGELVERGGDRVLQIDGKRLPPGTYQAIATLDYGGKTETGGEIAFEVH
jgi:P pilus assembly chaperone PapD